MNLSHYQKYAPVVVRIGISLVFLWFGTHELIDAPSFVGWLPDFITNPHGMMMGSMQMMHVNMTPIGFVHVNGLFEVVFGLLLLLGLFTRISAFLLGIHLLGIALSIGYNEIGVRDFGLTLATFSIFLHGPDRWCLDKKLTKRKVE